MTVSSSTNNISYTANGTSKNFTVPFYFIKKADLKVYRKIGDAEKELLVLNTDYTITGTAQDTQNETVFLSGGTVVLTEMPANGTKLTIIREVEYTQLADYQEAGTFPANLHEQALDKLTMQTQQLADSVSRSVTIDIFSNSDPSELVEKIEILYADKDNINTVAGSIGAVNVAADNIAAILSAPAQAAASAGSATASATSALDAANSAASALLSAESASQSETNAATSASQAAVSAAAAVGLPLGFSFFSDHLINNISYLRADTFSWQSGVTYKSMYDELVAQYNGVAEASTETLGGVTVTFKHAANGWKIVDVSQEQAVLDMYNAIGVAWYYVLDVANTRFKLPRKNPKYDAPITLAPVIGNGKSLYLTNGSYNKNLISYQGGSTQYLSSSAGGPGTGDNQIVPAGSPNVVASSFGTSVTLGLATSGDTGIIVDVPNMTYNEAANGARYLYFFVGNFTKTAVENTAGLNAELFNGKVDRNALNLSAEGKAYMSGLGMPSTRYINLTLQATGAEYTAPANGYFSWKGQLAIGAGGGWIYIGLLDSTGVPRLPAMQTPASNVQSDYAVFVPCAKGDKISLAYGGIIQNQAWRFIYAKGDE